MISGSLNDDPEITSLPTTRLPEAVLDDTALDRLTPTFSPLEWRSERATKEFRNLPQQTMSVE